MEFIKLNTTQNSTPSQIHREQLVLTQHTTADTAYQARKYCSSRFTYDALLKHSGWSSWCFWEAVRDWLTLLHFIHDLDLDSTRVQVDAWATLWRHSDLFWAATSASSQVIPILANSLLTVLLQFARGRPGPLLNPGTSQCNACRGIRWRSIRITCPSQRSLLSLSMSSMLCCPVLTLTSSFVTLSFQEIPIIHTAYKMIHSVLSTYTKHASLQYRFVLLWGWIKL